MAAPHDTAFSIALTTVERQLRLDQAEAETALAATLGEPVLNARARLRFGPGRTCEVLARVLDRAIVRAEQAGADASSLAVVEATAKTGEDIIRVRRKGYGVTDWIHTPTSSVRIVLGPAVVDSIVSAAHDEHPEPHEQPGRPSRRPLANLADEREPAVREALSEVIDPDLGVNIVDLGFVRAVAFDDQTAVITMTLTSATCPLTAIIEKQIENVLAGLPSIDGFRVAWQWIPTWRPDDVTDSGREQLRAIGFSI